MEGVVVAPQPRLLQRMQCGSAMGAQSHHHLNEAPMNVTQSKECSRRGGQWEQDEGNVIMLILNALHPNASLQRARVVCAAEVPVWEVASAR